jgi:hypothetical protein
MRPKHNLILYFLLNLIEKQTHDRCKRALFDRVDTNETLLEDLELMINSSIQMILSIEKHTRIPARVKDDNTIGREKVDSHTAG